MPTADSPTTANEQTIIDQLSMLLMASQAETSLAIKDGSKSVTDLTGVFHKMVRDILDIKLAAADMVGKTPDVHQKLLASCDACLNKARDAVTGFQFYDKLVQRLDHVSGSLKRIVAALENGEAAERAAALAEAKNAIQGSYTMEQDRALFHAILEGKPIETAIQISQEASAPVEGDVELF